MVKIGWTAGFAGGCDLRAVALEASQLPSSKAGGRAVGLAVICTVLLTALAALQPHAQA